MFQITTSMRGGGINMEISANLAQQIVSDMKNIINQELNFMNTNGYIIASTDPKRINTEHEGSKIVCATGKELIIESDQQYKGTRKGINIPVYFENQIIGVIGITGEKDKVSKFGQIIKKMTEILIKEAWLKELSIQRRENNRRIIEFLIFTPDSEKKLSNVTQMFDINITSSKNIIVGKIVKTKSEPSSQLVEALNSILEKYLSFNQQQVFTIKNDEIIIILDRILNEDLESILQNIRNEAFNKLEVTLIFGIGSPTGKDISIQSSYQQASSTVRWFSSFSDQCFHYFCEMDLGLILNRVSQTDKAAYLNKVFSRLSDEEIKEYIQILSIYGKNNGSITKSSKDLFIHKNTLQYKLNKLAKLTGYNPRDLDDYVILKLAFLLYELG